ncbi:MAG: FGGY-family carbohydrate kinase [Candidatus Hodarchaeota archaeon]
MKYIGIDLGSTGVKIIVADSSGNVLADINQKFSRSVTIKNLLSGRSEQNPAIWVNAVITGLIRLEKLLRAKSLGLNDVKAICTDSTSGTIIPVDEKGNPLYNAIMYNDNRARDETIRILRCSGVLMDKLGYKFKPSFSLPKILWLKENKPRIHEQVFKYLHANDFLVGMLTGEFYHSDASNCLKAGYDFVDNEWPLFIESELGLSIDLLPEVNRPGQQLGTTSKNLENFTSVPEGIAVLAGATDSTMALVASGASKVGDAFSSLGTTLVTRVLTSKLIKDPHGRFYCHKLPSKEDIYLPGGASSVGSECLQVEFPNADYQSLDKEAMEMFPTDIITYPLARKGERFPFNNPDARSFLVGRVKKPIEKYAALLEGVAHVERACYQVLESSGAKITGKSIFTIGGGAKSLPWLQIRADVMQKKIVRPKIIEAAYGCVLVCISQMEHNGHLNKAIECCVTPDVSLSPRASLKESIERKHQQFLSNVKEKYNAVL